MKRFITFTIAFVMLLAVNSANAGKKQITFSKPSFSLWAASGPWASIEDTLTTTGEDTIVVSIPAGKKLENFTPYVYFKPTSSSGDDSLIIHYTPRPMRYIPYGAAGTTGVVNLDTVTTSARIPISWRLASGAVDTVIRVITPATQGFFFPYVATKDASSYQDEFRPPNSAEWIFYYKLHSTADAGRVVFGVYYTEK